MVLGLEIGYVAVVAVTAVFSGIATLVGVVWKFGKKSEEHDELVEDVKKMETKLIATCISLREHIAEANQRDRDMKERLLRLDDRFNHVFNGKKYD